MAKAYTPPFSIPPLKRGLALKTRVEPVAQLIEGFQSPFGMELLASVHWVAKQEGAQNAQQALQKIQSWNPRKNQLMKAVHVEAAWLQLQRLGWV